MSRRVDKVSFAFRFMLRSRENCSKHYCESYILANSLKWFKTQKELTNLSSLSFLGRSFDQSALPKWMKIEMKTICEQGQLLKIFSI